MREEETRRADQEEEKAKNNETSEEELVQFQLEELVSPSIKEYAADHESGKTIRKPEDRADVAAARVEMEKRLALIKAWEDNEKAIADNKAFKKLCAIDAWESTKRVSIEAQMQQIEITISLFEYYILITEQCAFLHIEKIEKKKAEYRERMKNKMAIIHKAADEKKAFVESDRQKDFLAVEEAASKFCATGSTPKKLFACFSCFLFS
ncbi:hypothetical protein CDL12_00007 [Handroanthus impetiginosus]|uniref:Remorin C-terminal domain-containing protein n=1 Tax=Handroanthus impetiginosus TaxID=429701 RepID=A0A2G9IBT2_9LAMI|nr:hypothetical protein CDL12_00007 [Handroanthus impetiginosus]